MTFNQHSSLAAIVLTKNEESHIGACLDSLAWAERRVVFDSFSTDRTCDLAREHGAEVMQHRFVDFAAQRNAALEQVDADWVFFVDADERSTPELGAEIQSIVDNSLPLSETGEGPGMGVNGWQVPRLNYLFGKLTKGAGYWPDYQMRLLKRGCARYTRPASEIVELEGQSGCLTNALIHFNYESIDQFHMKQQARIDFEAKNLLAQNVKLRFYTPVYMAVKHFWWRFGTLQGYRDGVHGLRLSLLLADYFGYRYYRRAAELKKV